MRLVIEDAAGTRSVVPFTSDEITLGRAPEANTFRLAERTVSRRHARLVRANGAIWLEDLGSLTGTRVNGERITGRRRLREGDLIEIGDYDLALLPEEPGAPPPIPAGARTPTPVPGRVAATAAEPAPAPASAPTPPLAGPRAPTPAPVATAAAPRPTTPLPAALSAAMRAATPAPSPRPAPPAPAPEAIAQPPPPAPVPARAEPSGAPRQGPLGRAILAGAIALTLGFGAGWAVGTLTASAPPAAGGEPAPR